MCEVLLPPGVNSIAVIYIYIYIHIIYYEGGKVVNPTFLLEAESTPGPQCDRKDYVNEKFQ
jgi:hypothetical protein